MTDALRDAIQTIRDAVKHLDAEQRVEVFKKLTEGVCTKCGCDIDKLYRACHCDNDE